MTDEQKGTINYQFTVPARTPWSRVIKKGELLTLVDMAGQQAVDFLCYDASDPSDRYSSMNTIKMQGNAYVGKGTVLYSDSGTPLLKVEEDSLGRHDTIYGCCSNRNNFLRYGVKTTESCYSNFLRELDKHGLDRTSIVGNVNFFMQVPVLDDGSAGIVSDISSPGSFVDLRAEIDVLVVLSNCPQMHNPCNAYNPTPIEVIVRSPVL